MNKDEFIAAFAATQEQAHQTATEKGWWNKPREFGTTVVLMHSELSEAVEFERHGNPKSDHIPEFSGVEEEFADVVIRIMDLAQKNGYRVGEAIIAKMEFNQGHEFMHGGKLF